MTGKNPGLAPEPRCWRRRLAPTLVFVTALVAALALGASAVRSAFSAAALIGAPSLSSDKTAVSLHGRFVVPGVAARASLPARAGRASASIHKERLSLALPAARKASSASLAPRSTIDRLLAPGRFAYAETVKRLAARHAVEARLVMAIIASESGGDPEAVSPQGAVGLMQLMPDTAARLGVDPWDPEQNVEGAVRYLASLLSSFRSVDLSLVAYNAGPGFAMKYRAGEVELGAETRAFLIRVGKLLQ